MKHFGGLKPYAKIVFTEAYDKISTNSAIVGNKVVESAIHIALACRGDLLKNYLYRFLLEGSL